MKRKLIGITAATLLAVTGTTVLVAYVQSAKADAEKADEQVAVYVVTRSIRQGAPMSEVRDRVVLTDVPEDLVATGAVLDLALLDDSLVAGVELAVGEQLIRRRLVAPESLTSVDVPEGLQELTVSLDPERALGADLDPGDSVGIVISFEPFDLGAVDPNAPDTSTPGDEPTVPATPGQRSPNMSHLVLHRVLVTRVQFSQRDSERVSEVQSPETSSDDTSDSPDTTLDPTVAEAPSDQVLVTFALSSPQVEQVVFAAEFGNIWLTAQGPDTEITGTRIVSLANANEEAPQP
jgi:pilus assembly protein CpaB